MRAGQRKQPEGPLWPRDRGRLRFEAGLSHWYARNGFRQCTLSGPRFEHDGPHMHNTHRRLLREAIEVVGILCALRLAGILLPTC